MSCSDPIFVPITACEDCSSFEARLDSIEGRISSLSTTLSELSGMIEGLQESITNLGQSKQNKLTSGTGITMTGDTISVNNSVLTNANTHSVPISIIDEEGNIEVANALERNN